MLPTQRRQAILAELRQAKAVSAEELARKFGVSLETIRRDLRGLRDRGLLERVYGGALPVRSTEGDFATRSSLHAASKLAIARLAATLIEPEDTIVIDIGTTALEVARALPEAFRGCSPTGPGPGPGPEPQPVPRPEPERRERGRGGGRRRACRAVGGG
jgi:DeoR/GlpR family transcriptional regulator of sugar metabolism